MELSIRRAMDATIGEPEEQTWEGRWCEATVSVRLDSTKEISTGDGAHNLPLNHELNPNMQQVLGYRKPHPRFPLLDERSRF